MAQRDTADELEDQTLVGMFCRMSGGQTVQKGGRDILVLKVRNVNFSNPFGLCFGFFGLPRERIEESACAEKILLAA